MLRTCVLCCAMAATAGLMIGCKGGSETKDGNGKAAVDAKDKSKGPTSHEEAITAYKLKLDEFDSKIADLKEKAGRAAGDEKGKLEGKLKDANAKREAFEKKYSEFKAAAADKWDAVKKEVDSALDELRKAVE